MDDFIGIEAFAKVVEAGSFTAAAAHLRTVKSPISDAVRELEERLGVRLLERGARGMRPTEAGRRFYARWRGLPDNADASRAEAGAFQAISGGRLRVAVPESFGGRCIVPSLAGFLARFPSISIDVVAGAHGTRLAEGEFDLTIRIRETPENIFVARRIGSTRVLIVASPKYLIVASPKYLAARGTPRRPRDLVYHQCIGIAGSSSCQDRWCVGSEAVAVQPLLLVNATECLRTAAIAGLGLVPVPDWLVSDTLAAGELTCVLQNFATPSRGNYAVYPTNRPMAAAVRVFVEHLIGELRSRGVPT